MRRAVAALGRALAAARHPLATPQHSGRSQNRRLRPVIKGMSCIARKEFRNGRRRVGAKFLRSREPSPARRMSAEMLKYFKDNPGQAFGPAREPGDVLPHEDAAAVRVREAPAGA